MFESITRSLELMKRSFSILMDDKKLLLFPLISTIALILVIISFIVPAIFVQNSSGLLFYMLIFGFYLVSYFVIIFFNSALVYAASQKIDRRDVSFMQALGYCLTKLPGIIVWSGISATVGLVLNMLSRAAGSQRGIGGILSSLVVGLIGAAWSFATYFVVPVLVFEDVSPFSAIGRSVDLLKKTWGEKIVGGLGMGIAFFLLYLIGIGMIVLGFIVPGVGLVLAAIGVLFMVAVFLVQSTLQGIFTAALYKYATTGQVALFDKDHLDEAFKSKDKPFPPN